MSVKIAQSVSQHLSYVCKKICHHDLLKRAQYGHTAQIVFGEADIPITDR